MYERTRNSSSGYHAGDGYPQTVAKMSNDIGPRKTMFVLVVVAGCFAILWPKVFYPMLVGSANQHMKPSPIDKTTGCCDVFSEIDINTIKIMSELCKSIIQPADDKSLSGKEIVIKCKAEIQQTCGIDISAVLQEQIRLGRSIKQILSEVRSLNGSLCLKYHYGVAPWRLGVPHRITVNFTSNVRQERPPHMRSDIIHPAFRERGSAIPKPSGSSKRAPKIVEGRPGPIPGMRPTLGGAGHVVPPSQKTGSSMSVIMPIYTIGIVIFFTYTLMKLLFKKQPDGVGGSLYPPVDPDPRFRREVFESERCKYTPRLSRDPTGKIVVNAMSALLDEVNGEIEARRKANLFVNQPEQEHPSVKILGMETTASCEGGEKWNKPMEILVPVPHPPEPKSPPQEIYLQGALPAQSQLLVSDSAVVTEPGSNDSNSDPAVVLAGKMTLSVISLDDRESNELTIPSITLQAPEMVDLNGDSENLEEDPIEESKYTTASSATVAENEISDDEGTNNEVTEEEVDIERINDLELEEYSTDPLTNGALDFGEELTKEEAEKIEREVEEIQEEIEEKIEVRETDQETTEEKPKTGDTDSADKIIEIEKYEANQKQETSGNEQEATEGPKTIEPNANAEKTQEELEETEKEVQEIQEEVEEKVKIGEASQEILEEIEATKNDDVDFVDKLSKKEKSKGKGKEEASENEKTTDEQEKTSIPRETEPNASAEEAQENDKVENITEFEAVEEKEEITEEVVNLKEVVQLEEDDTLESKESFQTLNSQISVNEELEGIEKNEKQETIKPVTHQQDKSQAIEKNGEVEDVKTLSEVEISQEIEEKPRIDNIQQKEKVEQVQESKSLLKQQIEEHTIPNVEEIKQMQEDRGITGQQKQTKALEEVQIDEKEKRIGATPKEEAIKRNENVEKGVNKTEVEKGSASQEMKNEQQEPQKVETEVEEGEYEEEIEEYEIEVDDEDIEEIEIDDDDDIEKEIVEYHRAKK